MSSIATSNPWLDQKMEQADASRLLGNSHFKEGRHQEAISMYNVATTCVEAARDSVECLPMVKWNTADVAGWLHQHVGENVATAFANQDVNGQILNKMYSPSDVDQVACLGSNDDIDACEKDNTDPATVLAIIQKCKQSHSPMFIVTINQQHAKILGNRSLAKSKLKDYSGAVEDAKNAVELFPEWGKSYYRLGQCQLQLACMRQPNDPRMIDQARLTFLKGSQLKISEFTTAGEIKTMETQVRTCTKKLNEIMEEMKAKIAALDRMESDNGSSSMDGNRAADGGRNYSEDGMPRPPPGRPSPQSRNDVSILGCGLKDDHFKLKQKLDNGSSANSCNQMGQTALHVAAIWGAMKCGKLLVNHGANVNAKNKLSGGTPLMMAAQRGRIEFAKFLIQNGADMAQEDDRGMLAFNFARDDQLREMLGGPTSKLFDAVHENDLKLVEQISKENPELIAAEDPDGDTPLAIALWEKNWDIAMFFCRHPAALGYVGYPGSQGDTPLHQACKWEDEAKGIQLVLALLKAGANVNMKSMRNDEYHGGNYEKKNELTGKMMEISAEHRTPIFDAIEAGNDGIVACLLDRDAINVNSRDGDGCTPLYLALDEEEDNIAEMLLKKGADSEIGNMDIGDDNTLLAWACSRNMTNYVELLLKYKADPNVPGKSGLYPLHMAARSGGKQIIEALLIAGADKNKKDPSGKTPREIAEKNARSVKNGCVELLM